MEFYNMTLENRKLSNRINNLTRLALEGGGYGGDDDFRPFDLETLKIDLVLSDILDTNKLKPYLFSIKVVLMLYNSKMNNIKSQYIYLYDSQKDDIIFLEQYDRETKNFHDLIDFTLRSKEGIIKAITKKTLGINP